jgi:hypothetical protein
MIRMNNNELPMALPDQFSSCYLRSSKVPAMANCISQLLNGKYSEVENPKIKKGRRFEKYKKAEGKKKMDKHQWIGQFEVEKQLQIFDGEMDESPINNATKIYEKEQKREEYKSEQIIFEKFLN